MKTVEPFSSDWIKEIIAHMRRPRQICVCSAFVNSGKTEFDFYKCANCNGWMAAIRVAQSGISAPPQKESK